MKLCRYQHGYGLVEGAEVLDVTAHVRRRDGSTYGDALVASIEDLRSAEPSLRKSAKRTPISNCEFFSPIATPSKILAAPNNYRAHQSEMNSPREANLGRMNSLDEAGFFLKANTSLVGPAEGILQRFLDRRTDHEVEFVIIIGREIGNPIKESEALEAVAGYSLGLDITLRGPEERSLRKSLDSYTVLGPWLVTAEEMPQLSSVQLRLSVNGEPRQSASLSEMIFDAAAQIAYASRFYTLFPGDLIYTGTPSGVGPIRPGDVIRAEASGIGAMDVRVRAATIS